MSVVVVISQGLEEAGLYGVEDIQFNRDHSLKGELGLVFFADHRSLYCPACLVKCLTVKWGVIFSWSCSKIMFKRNHLRR